MPKLFYIIKHLFYINQILVVSRSTASSTNIQDCWQHFIKDQQEDFFKIYRKKQKWCRHKEFYQLNKGRYWRNNLCFEMIILIESSIHQCDEIKGR